MSAYTTVEHASNAQIAALDWCDSSWLATTSDGRAWRARAVLLATGVVDEHPDIPGYQQRWARSIHQCPYCHGWEVRDQPLALLASGEVAIYMAGLLLGWSSDVAVVTNGLAIAEPLRQTLTELSVPVFEAPISSLEGPGTQLELIRLSDGSHLARSGMFVALPQRQVSLVEQLGLDQTEKGFVSVDQDQGTSLPMLWAAGDLTSHRQQVVEAAAQGARAATAINAVLTLPSQGSPHG
jgi:thioredoxin reductase